MIIYRDLSELEPRLFRNPVVTLGVFDGVHRGHEHLIAGLKDWARELGDGERGGEAVGITFQSHPLAVLGCRDLLPRTLTHGEVAKRRVRNETRRVDA